MAKNNQHVLDKLFRRQHPHEIIEGILNDKAKYDGNRKQMADDCKVEYAAFCRSLTVMDNVFDHLGLFVFTPEQVWRIRRYVETLESMVE